jgi:hypothetical protein
VPGNESECAYVGIRHYANDHPKNQTHHKQEHVVRWSRRLAATISKARRIDPQGRSTGPRSNLLSLLAVVTPTEASDHEEHWWRYFPPQPGLVVGVGPVEQPSQWSPVLPLCALHTAEVLVLPWRSPWAALCRAPTDSCPEHGRLATSKGWTVVALRRYWGPAPKNVADS